VQRSEGASSSLCVNPKRLSRSGEEYHDANVEAMRPRD
jgi:hypothetical protein